MASLKWACGPEKRWFGQGKFWPLPFVCLIGSFLKLEPPTKYCVRAERQQIVIMMIVMVIVVGAFCTHQGLLCGSKAWKIKPTWPDMTISPGHWVVYTSFPWPLPLQLCHPQQMAEIVGANLLPYIFFAIKWEASQTLTFKIHCLQWQELASGKLFQHP